MMKVIISIFLFCLTVNTVTAQQTREELEKQRQALRKEIDESQKQLNIINAQKNKGLYTLGYIANKVHLHERLVENLNKDLHILDDNIYSIQKDVHRYDRLLDTLKQEYARSMVYSYKNRGNYEFLNFIFSADNFNDAIKRISYMKSYRTYREMQGDNILRTQELRRKRLEDLGASKEKKNSTLDIQSKEMATLEDQKAQQAKVVESLKKQGKDLNARIAAKQREIAKVNGAVKAAIARAILKDKADRLAAAGAAAPKPNGPKTTTAVTGSSPKTPRVSAPVTAPDYKILNDENIALGNSFEKSKGNLPWPVDNGAVIMHYGLNNLGDKGHIETTSVTISSPIGSTVKSVFDGTVILVAEIDDGKDMVTIKHGDFYTTYSNVSNVTVKKDQAVARGQVVGRVAQNLDGIGSIDFYCAKGYKNYNPEDWLRRH